MKTLNKCLALAALALLPSVKALAQDVVMKMGVPDQTVNGASTLTVNGVTAKYVLGNGIPGAYIYNPDWSSYYFTLTSSKPIAVIEMDGKCDTRYATNTADVACTTGELHMHPDETSIWQGNATAITFKGAQKSSRYFFTELRIWFVGTPYGKQYVADPTIKAADGKMNFASETPGTTFTYNMQLATDGKLRMCDGTVALDLPLVVNVLGAAQGYENSTTITQTIPFATLYGKQGDADADGRLSTADLQLIIDTILKKNAK